LAAALVAVVETQALSRLLEPGQELLQAVVLERRSDTALEPAGDRGPKPAVCSQASGTGAGGISTPLKETRTKLMRSALELSADLHTALAGGGDGSVQYLSSFSVRQRELPALPARDAEDTRAARAIEGAHLQFGSWTTGPASYLCPLAGESTDAGV
jgi:hypothetical protein